MIGGPGAFVVPIRERDQFKEATRTKLVLEIAGHTPQRAGRPGAGAHAAHLLHASASRCGATAGAELKDRRSSSGHASSSSNRATSSTCGE